jgi:O-antigen ligase
VLFISAGLMVFCAREQPQQPYRLLRAAPLALAAWIVLQRLTFMRSADFLGDLYAFRTQTLCLFACFVAFYLTESLCRDSRRCRRIVSVLLALALGEAFYGLAQHLLGWPYILTHKDPGFLGDATGTYINHDHFAGFLEMIFPFCVSLAMMHSAPVRERTKRRNASKFLSRLDDASFQKTTMLALAGVTIFVAIVFSQSRMGLVAATMSLAAIIIASATHRNGARAAILAAAFLAAGVIAALWIGAAPVITHFATLPQEAATNTVLGSRISIWRDSFILLLKHPLIGLGLGAFPYAFTRVQDTFVNLIVLHAHNDYLEYAVELGIPAALLLFGMILTVAAGILRVCRRTPRDTSGAAALGALGGVVALLLHSLVDFNLHIPANALVFSVILGVGSAVAHMPREAHGRHRAHGQRRSSRVLHATPEYAGGAVQPGS